MQRYKPFLFQKKCLEPKFAFFSKPSSISLSIRVCAYACAETGTSLLKRSVFHLLELHRKFIEEQQKSHEENMAAQQKDDNGDDTTEIGTATAIAGHALPPHPSNPLE